MSSNQPPSKASSSPITLPRNESDIGNSDGLSVTPPMRQSIDVLARECCIFLAQTGTQEFASPSTVISFSTFLKAVTAIHIAELSIISSMEIEDE